MKTKRIFLATVLMVSASANAVLTAEEIKELGATRTVWGAIKAGNKDGTIPAYDGGLSPNLAPAGFKKGSGHWADPFAAEKPLYSITSKNMDQYAGKLGEVTKELLRRFPTFRVDVYPTHRVVNYPQRYLDNTLKNAANCKLVEDGQAVAGCLGGTPFPIPKNGNEVMFNVQLAYRSPVRMHSEPVYVDASGNPVTSAIQIVRTESPYYDPRLTVESFEAKGAPLFRGVTLQLYPPRIAGDGTMTVWSANRIKWPSKGWTYQQGTRRVRAVPNLQYDYPLSASGGAQFYDEVSIFSGNMDRFDFKLVGTQEMIIPYNNYRAVDTPKEEMTAVGGGHHPNPDKLRWELHRTTVVEATLKPGMRHAYSKRRYYLDEDFAQAGMVDNWDQAGKIYRGYFGLFHWYYDAQSAAGLQAIALDLSTGVWYLNAQIAGREGVRIVEPYEDSFFTAEGLSRQSSR